MPLGCMRSGTVWISRSTASREGVATMMAPTLALGRAAVVVRAFKC